jgi:outer membrane protein assembly factor BamD
MQPAERNVTIKMKLLMFAVCFLVNGCTNQSDLTEQVEKPVESLYGTALNTVLNGDPKAAAPAFEEVERQHPYSELAIRAQIMAAWSFYQDGNYSRANASLDRFIELNPTDSLIEYAYYLKALCYYEQIVDVERDAEMSRLALSAFEELVRRFPNGPHARDGKLKIDLISSHLAAKEMAVGRFYLKNEYYTAAIRRFKIVTKDYNTSNQVPEALYRLAEAYLAMGLVNEANRFYEVAAYNYSNSIWTSRLKTLLVNPEMPQEKGYYKWTIDMIKSVFN